MKYHSIAYNIIKKYYNNKVTLRSNVPLINHIDEGINILIENNASKNVIDAYCLHPIL